MKETRMFPIHQCTRRWICRASFLVFGVVPMACVAAWSASIHSGAHLAAVRSQLAECLGLDVRLDRVSYPRPGITLLEGLQLADPETGEVLASMRLLEIGGDERMRTIVASQPELDAVHAAGLWKLADRSWSKGPQ